ncbi:hypothetical protein [Microbacterium saperdae]|uniref:Uncharacterized protein n=1 Tax=Microbacterium saperdae TaxID=69368 RepID=A0A543BAJ5_9MICO|nr:hypothetical protein [Microbacterium saperdae]TQL81857.1 hypothetical protein FB560_3337 [Microbacterium saperdae]GGM35321.1 hypothetical protein GCM10010489_02730 [Microbacterium saperdae]
MTFTPLRSKSRNLYPWFATRRDLFQPERSPKKTMTWGIIAGLMVVLALLIYLNPEATVDLLGGRVRSGLAIAGAFALPPVVFVVSIVMIFIGARRWRIKGGGVLTNPVIHGVSAAFPLEPVLDAIRAGRSEGDTIVAGLSAMQKAVADDRLLTIWASDEDRIMYVGVLRVDGDAIWLDAEPFRVDGDRFFDAKDLDAKARQRGVTG